MRPHEAPEGPSILEIESRWFDDGLEVVIDPDCLAKLSEADRGHVARWVTAMVMGAVIARFQYPLGGDIGDLCAEVLRAVAWEADRDGGHGEAAPPGPGPTTH